MGGSSTGEGDRTPKKAKPKKIPQRGLGITALENLRREEQQKKIAVTFATGDNIASPFLPVLNPRSSPRPCYIGNSALFRPPLDAGDGTAPLPRYSLKTKDFLSPPSPSEAAGLQMELPSNQSYRSMNPPPSRTEEQRLVGMRRPWLFHSHNFDHGSPLTCGNELKITALTREDASGSSHGGRTDLGRKVHAVGGQDAELDGSFLSLGPSKHYMSSLKSNQAEKSTAAEGSLRWRDNVIVERQAYAKAAHPRPPPTLYNFMQLPDNLIGNKPGGTN